MAYINGTYIFVEDESADYTIDVSSHPVEQGMDITDTIRKRPVTMSITGKAVDYNPTTNPDNTLNIKADRVLEKLKAMQLKGTLVTYEGRNLMGNALIVSISTSHPYTNAGGADISITLQECRLAQNSYIPPTPSVAEGENNGTQQVEKGENKEVYHITKPGDIIWNLVTGDYKELDPTYEKIVDKCNWVMSQNQSAFSIPGDFTTLQIGKKILIGYRK